MRIDVKEAQRFVSAMLEAQGLAQEQADAVSQRLVEGELLGHRTHGLAQVAVYLQRIADGLIARDGDIRVISDRGATFAWAADQLPGPWVMNLALAQAFSRAKEHPVVTFTLSNCSHLGALQPYVKDAAERKLFSLMAVTSPAVQSVAPFGGVAPVLTTNPLASGIPTHGDPILVDQSTSLTSNATVAGYGKIGRRLPGKWLLDARGQLSDDPSVLDASPAGTILPLGGSDYGYKGFGFGLIAEALSLALSGTGRHASAPRVRGSQGVYFQLIDCDALGGREQFLDEMTAVARSCRASPPAAGHEKVRLPGERALERWREQQREGLVVEEEVARSLVSLAMTLGLCAPVFRNAE
jgi:LDH2 family malate/lactate/ureidoglycolate dehydrogenase